MRTSPPLAERADSWPEARVPERGERVLVITPHPDDEALGAAGLIRRAALRGAEVRTLFLTSGDAFLLCAMHRAGSWPSLAARKRLAAEREGEARRSLQALGVSPDAALFLRYPDRGLAALWLRCWREAESLGNGACGETLLRELERQVVGVDCVYYPDAADDHPDHWAAHCFTRLALRRRFPEGGPVERTYLVHRGMWPHPFAPRPDAALLPPGELPAGPEAWETLPLSAADLAAKREALRAHASQQPLMGRFLSAFLRANELFRRAGVEPAGAWLPEPVRDRWGRARCAGADIAALSVAAEGAAARLRIRLRGPALPGLTYLAYWKPVDGPAGDGWTRAHAAGPGRRGGWGELRVEGAELEAEIALAEGARLMIGAEAWAGPVLLDRALWRLVEPSGPRRPGRKL